jgi:hypothetical protein
VYTGFALQASFPARFSAWFIVGRTTKTAVIRGFIADYFRFIGIIEAQTLCAVLPIIRAHRLKLPRSVYENPDYRMRNGKPITVERPQRAFPDEQEIQPRRLCLQGVAPGDHRAGVTAGYQAARG